MATSDGHVGVAARRLGFTPHVAQSDTDAMPVLDGHTFRLPGNLVSHLSSKRIDLSFLRREVIRLMRKLRDRGQLRVDGIISLRLKTFRWRHPRTLNWSDGRLA